MCGIVGFLDKHRSVERPVGRTILAMLQALSCRGPDSAGVAIFDFARGGWLLRVRVPEGFEPAAVIRALDNAGHKVHRHYQNGVYDAIPWAGSTAKPGAGGQPAKLTIEADPATVDQLLGHYIPGAEVICLGEGLDLFKQVGSPDELEVTYGISELTGTHGIGHTRLSTESRVDLSHSQPFWAHGVPDLATVHNGHITNYHKLRRQYEQRGYRFFTENDSEVIGVYLRDRMAAGLPLEDALRSSLDDFDGSFSYLAASGQCLAYVKDRYGFKPLVVAETDAFVAIATEEIALRKALGSDFVAREPAPGSMHVWRVPAAAAAINY